MVYISEKCLKKSEKRKMLSNIFKNVATFIKSWQKNSWRNQHFLKMLEHLWKMLEHLWKMLEEASRKMLTKNVDKKYGLHS
jgi:hypothetical protein